MREKNWKKVIGGRSGLLIISIILIFFIIIALDEILDLPRLLLGAPLTPINWTEIAIDTVVFFVIGLTAIVLIRQAESKRKETEEVLRESEESFRDLFENANDLIQSVDASGRFVYVNKKWLETLGYSKEELGRLKLSDILREDQIPHCMEIFIKLCSSESFENVETVFVSKGGREIVVEGNVSAKIKGGKSIATRCIFRDITERKRAEEALRDSEKKYRTLVETAQEGISIAGPDENIIFVNQAFADLLGYKREELLGLNLKKITDKDGFDKFREETKKRKKGESSRYEAKVYTKAGELKCFSISATPIFDGKGAFTGSLGMLADITERMKAEQAVKESEEKFRNLAEESPNMIFINMKGRVVYANKKCEEVMGYKREEFYSPDFDFLTLIAPESKDSVKARFRTHSNGEEVAPYEYVLVTKEGEKIEAILTTKLMNYEEERATLGIVTDITERKRAEEALRQRTHDLGERVKELKVLYGASKLMAEPDRSLDEVFQGLVQLLPSAWQYPSITCARITFEERQFNTDNFSESRWRQSAEIMVFAERMGFVEVYYLEEKPEVHEGPFLKEERYLIDALVEEIGRFIERKKTEEALQRKADEQEQLLKTARHLTATLDVKEVLTRIGHGAKEILKAHGCAIYLLEADGKTLRPVVAIEPPYDQEILATPLNVDTSFTGKAVKAKKSLIFNHAGTDPSGQQILDTPEEEYEHIITSPFIVDGKVLGGMCLNRMEILFSEEDLALAETFATYAATALKNAQTHHDLKQEIEERKKAEKSLRESEEKFRTAFNTSPDLFYRTSPEGKVLDCNQAVLKTLGYSEDEIIGKPLFGLYAEESKEDAKKYFKEGAKTGMLRNKELKVVAKDGRKIDVELNVNTIYDRGGNIISTISSQRDITERKKLLQQLIQSEKLVAVGTLAYGIAHEFNNILAGMMGNAELGLITRDSQQIKECFETIVENTKRASSITNNLLVFTREEEAKKELTDITQPLRSVLAITKRELEKGNIEIVEEITPVPKILCDSGQFSEVFLNMITNARDAMHPKGGTLTIKLEPWKDNIRIIFKDTGCGIPDEIKGRIFDPFVTTKGALGKSDVPGTGLGLFLSYGIIDSYQGKIEVESKVRKGTQFTILISISQNLPRKPLVDTVIETSREIQGKLNILLVDDERSICITTKRFLESKGHKVTTSLRADEGLKFFKKDKFDVVISDITMPDMDGIELIKKMRRKDKKTRIIVMTGHILKGMEEEAKKAGADEVLVKPFKNDLLYGTISRIIF